VLLSALRHRPQQEADECPGWKIRSSLPFYRHGDEWRHAEDGLHVRSKYTVMLISTVVALQYILFYIIWDQIVQVCNQG